MPQSPTGRLAVLLSAVACLALVPGAARADKCLSAKLKAIGKKEAGLLNCQSKIAQKGDPSTQTACDAKVVAKFNKAFAKAGACSGVLADCEAIADDCRDKVRAALPDGTSEPTASKCEAKRLKAAGKKASSRLGCYSKSAKKDEGVDGTPGGCLDKAAAKFTTSYDKETGCTGDGQTATVESLIDSECVAQLVTTDGGGVVTALCPTTTTTTSTSTTTSTTTTTLICGNGLVDLDEDCDPPGSSCGGTSTCTASCKCDCDLSNCPCDPLDTSACIYPFPSDFYTVADNTKDTGLRVNFPQVAMAKNQNGVAMDTTEYNRADGFSPGTSILLKVPDLDLTETDAPVITDIARSLDADSPIVVVNATTLAHHLLFAELDANASDDAHRSLIIRPSVNFEDGQRYIVALRNLKQANSSIIPPGSTFAAYRDNTPCDPACEARRPHMESLFTTLAAAGVTRNDLYLAWDFTVASTRSLTERMLFMRDDAFTNYLGSNAPSFTVTLVENNLADTNIYRRVTGTYQVDRYVDSTTAPARLVLDSNGLPVHQATPQPASFICIIPRSAISNDAGPVTPARASIYGHGLLGSNDEVNAGNVKSMANEHNFVAAGILQQLGKFPSFPDRQQQGMLNQLYLARLMIHPNGFNSNAAFQDTNGSPVIDPSDVFYDGNSQGGIFGGTVMAISQDITRGVLGVPGMNYSLLLTRSVDFEDYSQLLYPSYPPELTRPLLLALIQMLWDRSEPNGYANHMTSNLLPNTPQHYVLLHEAFGDHQVSNVATEVEARTIGASIHSPPLGAGRSYEVTPAYGIPAIASYPFNGSALVVWDSGTPTPPTANVPNDAGADPHSKPRSNADARTQKSEFLKTGGAVVDVCSGLPCLAP